MVQSSLSYTFASACCHCHNVAAFPRVKILGNLYLFLKDISKWSWQHYSESKAVKTTTTSWCHCHGSCPHGNSWPLRRNPQVLGLVLPQLSLQSVSWFLWGNKLMKAVALGQSSSQNPFGSDNLGEMAGMIAHGTDLSPFFHYHSPKGLDKTFFLLAFSMKI